MSYDNFKEVCQMLREIPGYESSGGKPQSEIRQAEAALNICFSRQFSEFLQQYDYVDFDGGEIFGIKDGADSTILEGNFVAYTLYDRKHYNMPRNWIPVYNFYDSSLAYADYSVLNGEKEPRVIRAYYDGRKKKYEVIEVLADDFGDFLRLLIKLHS